MKFRITGLPEEINAAIPKLKEIFNIYEVSSYYPNRNSQYVRVYIEGNLKGADADDNL